MGGVDTTRWKPRRTKGTVIYKTRNQFAWAVIAAGTAIFATYYTVVSYVGGDGLKERLRRDFFEKTEEEVDRRNLMRFSLVAPKRGDTIRKLLEEEKDDQTKNAESTANGKTSRYFAKAGADVCAEEDTFIVIHSEESGEENEVRSEQGSRRRTQKPPEACPNDGPKLPKLRKKTAEGNALISNFLASQPSQKAEGDDDFEEAKVGSPKLQPKKTKVQRAVTKKPAKAPRRPKNQADIRKVFKKYKNDHEVLQELLKEHSAAEQIDPEQLQIALAMSRSLADQECSNHPTTSAALGGEEAQMANSSGTSEERRIVSIRTTLEQFGFRCKNSYTDYDLNVIFGSSSGTKNVKKIKHKRATNLQPRSREELAAFIDGQAKKLFPVEMMQNAAELATPLDLESCLTSLFWIAQTELPSEQLMEMYYVPELLEANPAPVGCMLKDWSKIPGRECTPERELDGSAGLGEAVEVERGNEDRSVTEQEGVIVLDDNSEEEEDKFVTAPEMSECPQPVFHQSSENIFEDTDPNPMVSFEAYSSEEEKISAASRTAVGTVSANGDIRPVDQVPNAVVREDDGKCNTFDREGDCHESEQKKENISYMAWCAVPLHISFFNLVSESETLQRQILRYEPINLDDIYGILKDGGLRYETNDLIAFLDKYCITFRTAAASGDRTAKVKPKPDSK
uniref:Structure-specific endonuclease subunit SLX4 n=1 Tax=Anopheles melas TaxID=34690 RepID=A0A182UG37_9DIPT